MTALKDHSTTALQISIWLGLLTASAVTAEETLLVDFDKTRLGEFRAIVSSDQPTPFQEEPFLIYRDSEFGDTGIFGGNIPYTGDGTGARDGQVQIISELNPKFAGIRIATRDGKPVNSLLLWDQSSFRPEFRDRAIEIEGGRMELRLEGRARLFPQERGSWGIRMVLRDGDRYFLSRSAVTDPGLGGVSEIAEEGWLEFSPHSTDLDSLAESVGQTPPGAFVERDFQSITAAGFWVFVDRREYSSIVQIEQFSTYVRIPEPSAVPLLLLLSMLALRRSGRFSA